MIFLMLVCTALRVLTRLPNVPRVAVPLARTPRKLIPPLFMTPCASASQRMGWNSYGAGIYSNVVEPNQGICILQLFLLARLEEQRPGSGVCGSSAHGILPAAFPGGRAAWGGMDTELEIIICQTKKCPRVSRLRVAPCLEVGWARVSAMGGSVSWNCPISSTRVTQKWNWSQGGGWGDLFEYKEGDFSCLPEEFKSFSKQCLYLAA